LLTIERPSRKRMRAINIFHQPCPMGTDPALF
jgi:hypothetical protein